MTAELVSTNEPGLLLNAKALSTLIGAVKFRLADWRAKTSEDMDEDRFAELQNDIGYLEILLSNLQDEYARKYPARRQI
jgi:hypothetical protein